MSDGQKTPTTDINWAAHGDRDIEHTKNFHELMGHAIRIAGLESEGSVNQCYPVSD